MPHFNLAANPDGSTTLELVERVSGVSLHDIKDTNSYGRVKGVNKQTNRITGESVEELSNAEGTFKLDINNEYFTVGAATAPMTGEGVWAGMDGADPEFRVGDPSGQYIHYNGSTFDVAVSVFSSGTYTPTLTNTTNLDASTAYLCHYMRIGSVVHVSGRLEADATAAGLVVLGISLPVASDITVAGDCTGVGAHALLTDPAPAIAGDVTNNRATMTWTAADVTNHFIYFTLTYRII